MDELTIVTAELDAMVKPLEELKKQITTLTVTVPVKGVVDGAHAHPLGTEVPAGANVAKVTPLGAGTIIEIRIASADINRVRAGQAASVRIKAAGFKRYGGMTGRLLDISPSAFSDDQGVAYYRGTIILDRVTCRSGRWPNPIDARHGGRRRYQDWHPDFFCDVDRLIRYLPASAF